MALAAAAAVAIENSRLYERTRQREQWQQAVADIANSVLAGTDPEEVLALVANRARTLTGADVALVALPDDDERAWSSRSSTAATRGSARARVTSCDIVGAWEGQLVPRASLAYAAYADGVSRIEASSERGPGARRPAAAATGPRSSPR